VEVKTGAIIQQFTVGACAGPVASPPLRVHAGLGDNTKVDWLRILWPDAVLQAELELPAERVTKITELQRKTSSCPYLFAWNGNRFEFVADFGGVGGLGYWVGPDTYACPDPTEYIPIPELHPRDGEFVLKCLTPLEEVTYLDEVKLLCVEHPAGTEIRPNEMMAVRADPPQFQLFCFAERLRPLSAKDHRGVDVTDQVLHLDRDYAGATHEDPRFLGFAQPHFVELDFGQQLGRIEPSEQWILCAQGWVEYGYSSTNYAAYQAGLQPKAPSVHVWRDGHWVELCREIGYPAGINHGMTIDLAGKLRPGDRRLRVSSNMDLYWDQIFLARHDPQAEITVQESEARWADLQHVGYPREYSPDGRRPNLCDYDNLDRSVAWKLMTGDYTRFGDVAPLLDKADDCFVIMGHGDEVTLRFAASAFGTCRGDRRRTYLLKTDSYCKDMDLYTAHPDTVHPLPFHGMSGYPYGTDEHYPDTPLTRAYRQEYNTRRVGAR
jgi:hypothetical protein